MPHRVIKIWRINPISIFVFIVAGAVAGLLIFRSFATGSARLYLSPNSAEVEVNSNITINVMIDTNGATAHAVDARLSYDTSKLQFVAVDDSSSAFDIRITATGGSGSVRFEQGAQPPFVTGNQLVGKVTFKAIGLSGSTPISFASGSEVVYGGESILGATDGSSIALTSTILKPHQQSPQTSDNDTTDSTPENPAQNNAPDDTTADSSAAGENEPQTTTPEASNSPRIIDLKPVYKGYKKVRVGFATSEPTKTTIRYGIDQLDQIVEDNELKQEHDIALDSSKLSPGMTYTYQVTATDSDGNSTTTNPREITTKGYSVTIKLLDSNNQPVKNLPVYLFSSTRQSTTDDNGEGRFYDVSAGGHTLKFAYGGQDLEQNVEVKDILSLANADVADETEANPQYFQVYAAQPGMEVKNQDALMLGGIAALVVLTAGLGIYLFAKSRKVRFPKGKDLI